MRAATLLAPGCDRNAYVDSITLHPRPFAAALAEARKSPAVS